MTAKKRSISSQFEADLHCLTQVEDGGHRVRQAREGAPLALAHRHAQSKRAGVLDESTKGGCSTTSQLRVRVPSPIARVPFSLPPTPPSTPTHAQSTAHQRPPRQLYAEPLSPQSRQMVLDSQPIAESPLSPSCVPGTEPSQLALPPAQNPFAKDDPREDVYRQFTSEIANLQAHAQRIRQMPAQLVRTYIYSLKCCVETIRSLVVASADTTVPHDAADTDDEDNDAKEVAKEATRTRTTKAETVAVAAAAAAAAAATVATAAKAGKTVPKPADADTEERHLSGESDDDGDDDGDAVDSDLAGLKVLALVTEVGRTDRRYGTFCVPSARLSDADWILIMTWKERFSRDARKRLVHHTPGQQARDARLAAAMYKMIYAWKPMHEGDFDSLRVDEAIKFKFDGDNPPRSAEPYDEEDAVDDADDKIDEAVIARDIAEGNEGDNEDEAGDDEDDGYDEQAALTR